MSLDIDGKTRLKNARELIKGGMPIDVAIRTSVKGVTDKARRSYLWRQLGGRLRPKKKRGHGGFKITPAMRLDAYRHEKSLIRGIPQDDL